MQESWPRTLKARGDWPRRCLSLALFLLLGSAYPARSNAAEPSATPQLNEILTYIHDGWDRLTRSMSSCKSVVDPKVAAVPVVYLPADFGQPPEIEQMQHECQVTVMHLPEVIPRPGTPGVESIQPAGLLYLKNKYVVPGGRFNEMYGWDSYFIIRGLLRDGRLELARGMVDNFFFEIEHYGAVLNANRTYYLTRSQPPFLSSMVMAVHEAQKAAGQDDRSWLENAFSYVKRDHEMWTRAPHLAGTTGLSRYYDFGEGPAQEALQDEEDIYRQAASYFLFHPTTPAYQDEDVDPPGVKPLGAAYSVRVCDTPESPSSPSSSSSSSSSSSPSLLSCAAARLIRLTPDYYKGDRAMRESGFDISFRFGPYGAATHHYAPVCLNSLLFKTERDLAEMSRVLGKTSDAEQWRKASEARRQSIYKYLWDERQGLFFDYNFDNHERSTYRYATTFYPLWAGVASDEQARAVVNNLSVFEKPGGIVMSVEQTGVQWDYPFGWAPIQLLAVEGIRSYGYGAQANRVSEEFLSMVLQNFERDKTIREKYDVVTRSSETMVKAGYAANVIGFGWTNAAFVELLHALPAEEARHVADATPAIPKSP